MLLNKNPAGAGEAFAETPLSVPPGAAAVQFVSSRASLTVTFHGHQSQSLELSWAAAGGHPGGARRLAVPAGCHAVLVRRDDLGQDDADVTFA